MTRTHVLLATSVLSVAIGCGGSSLGGDGQPGVIGNVTASTWVTDLTAAYCAWAVRCGQFRDAAYCTFFAGAEFAAVNFNQASAAVTAVSDGKAQFDPTQAASCLTAMSNLSCDVDFLSQATPPAACMMTFSGSLPIGGTCIDDVECEPGLMCVVASTATCEGTCTPTSAQDCRMDDDCPIGQFCAAAEMQGPGLWGSGVCETVVPPGASAGAPCGSPVQCAPGLFCAGGPAPATCAADVGVGAACGGFNGATCASGLACVTSDDGATAACMAAAKLGDTCTSLFQCGAQYALSDIICDETGTKTCVPRPSTGPCTVVDGINTCDLATGYCDGSTAAGTCKPWLPAGAPCALTANRIDPCGLWSGCQDSVCVPVLGACTPQ
jgi:hypothetical protein